MDLLCFHSRSRLKIRRAPSCKISATCSSSQTSSSLHGSCCRQNMKKKSCNSNNVRQPLIFHTFEPEIMVTEPAEFMSVVQRLTGSPNTRRLQRMSARKSKEMQLLLRIPEVQLMQQGMQKDPLKEGSTIITLAPTTLISNIDLPPSPSCPNPNPNDSINHIAPDLPPLSNANPPLLSHTINPPLSPASKDLSNSSCLSSDKNQCPSSSLSSNPAVFEADNPFSSSSSGAIMNMSKESCQVFLPFSPHSSSFLPSNLPSTLIKPNSKCKPLIMDNNQICSHDVSPNCGHSTTTLSILLPAKASDELPPVSPSSSVSTSNTSSEDNVSTEGGAYSPCRELGFSWLDEEVEGEAEEDGSIHFFVFSGDSYYGSVDDAAQDDDEVDFQYMDSSSQFNSMPLETPSSFLRDSNILLED